MKVFPCRLETIIEPEPVREGAGVRLKRSIGTRTLDHLDPFLLLDHVESSDPHDYQAGFPWHPHRGIETVTYVLKGEVRHRDTLGHAGRLGAGDVQWMTAGRGILHEEMPQVRPEGIAGFQLWVNLPAKLKMAPPRYQEVRAGAIPVITRANGARVRVMAGTVDGVRGPVTGLPPIPCTWMCSWPLRPPSTSRSSGGTGHLPTCSRERHNFVTRKKPAARGCRTPGSSCWAMARRSR